MRTPMNIQEIMQRMALARQAPRPQMPPQAQAPQPARGLNTELLRGLPPGMGGPRVQPQPAQPQQAQAPMQARGLMELLQGLRPVMGGQMPPQAAMPPRQPGPSGPAPNLEDFLRPVQQPRQPQPTPPISQEILDRNRSMIGPGGMSPEDFLKMQPQPFDPSVMFGPVSQQPRQPMQTIGTPPPQAQAPQMPPQAQRPAVPDWYNQYLGSVGQPGMQPQMPKQPGQTIGTMPAQPAFPVDGPDRIDGTPGQQAPPGYYGIQTGALGSSPIFFKMPQQPPQSGMTNPAMNPMQFKKGGSVKKAAQPKVAPKRAPANRGQSNMSALAKALKGK